MGFMQSILASFIGAFIFAAAVIIVSILFGVDNPISYFIHLMMKTIPIPIWVFTGLGIVFIIISYRIWSTPRSIEPVDDGESSQPWDLQNFKREVKDLTVEAKLILKAFGKNDGGEYKVSTLSTVIGTSKIRTQAALDLMKDKKYIHAPTLLYNGEPPYTLKPLGLKAIIELGYDLRA